MAGIAVVPVDSDGLDRLVAIHNAVQPDDPTTVEEVVDWRRQAQGALWLVATVDGADAGAAIGLVGWHSDAATGRGYGWVLPPARGRGAGSALLAELTRWSLEQGRSALQTEVAEDDDASLAWLTRRGFGEVGRESRLVLDLGSVVPPETDAPSGIEITTWAERPGIERDLYAVYVEAEPDIPGDHTVELAPFEGWLASDMQGISDRPQGVFVALAGDEVVGYAKLAFPPEGRVVFHDLTGVKRSWRGRGIGGALKRAQIAWAKEQGYERLVTGNEERNEPIRRLNLRYGYRLEPGKVLLRKSVSAGA